MLDVTMLKDREVSELINLALGDGPVPPKQFSALVKHGFAAGGGEVDQHITVPYTEVMALQGLLVKRQVLRQIRRARQCFVTIKSPSGDYAVQMPVTRRAMYEMIEGQDNSEFLKCNSSRHWDAAHIANGNFYWD